MKSYAKLFTAALALTLSFTTVLPASATERADLPPASAFMKGVAYTAWSRTAYSSSGSNRTLSQQIKPMGVTWISLLVTCYQGKAASTQIVCDSRKGYTPTDESLIYVIRYAHSLGMRVMLKPHVDLTNDPTQWRGSINFGGDEGAWKAWFDSYTQFITHYAALAQTAGADYFVIGTEMQGTSHRADQWRGVIKAVRAVYSGPVTYAANWGEEENVQWWDALDAIGVDAFYKLTEADNPTVGESGKVGTVDLQEQADCYQALFETFNGKSWWRGVFWWNWEPLPDQGGAKDRGFTANNKPAENILRLYYGASPRAK
ncbi:MAG: hypothetical protein HZB17_03490 [Chloroflexi bacterium]|nr:hypothetical protein [Chloroflexota bacterium]